MSLLFLASMMMAQAPATQPQPATAQRPAAKKQKPKQVCEYVEITGSRSKRRVCHDDGGNLDLGPGIQSGSYDASRGQTSIAAPGGGSN